MSSKLKVFGAVVLGFLVLLGGTFFYVKSKINPEEIRKLTVEAIAKAMPGADVSLGSVDYALGLNVKLGFNDLQIKLKAEDKIEVINIKDFHVKIPVWAIITNGGTIDINVQNPHVNFKEYSEKVNSITLALGKKDEASSDKKDEGKTDASSGSDKIEVPGFIAKSKLNVRVTDILLKYSKLDGSNGEISFNRFLLKNVNLETATAFEIESDIAVNLKGHKKFHTHGLVIGQVNLSEFVKEKKIDTSLVVDITSTSMTGLNYKIPDIKSKIRVIVPKEGAIKLDIESSFGSLAQTQVSVEMLEKKMDVKNLKLDVFLKELNSMLDKETAQKLAAIDFGKSNFFIQGDLTLDDGNLSNSNVNFGLTNDIVYHGAEGLKALVGMKGRYQNENLLVSLNNKVLDGTINVDIKGKLNPMAKDFSVDKMGPIQIDVLATNAKFSTEMIRKNLYAKKPETAQAKATGTEGAGAGASAAAKPTMRKFPHLIVDAKWKQIIVGKDEFSGNGKIVVQNTTVGTDGIHFQFSKGKGLITFFSKQEPNFTVDNKFTFNLTGLNLSSLGALLPPVLESIKGDFSGDVKGTFTQYPKSSAYNVSFNLNASNGEIKGLNMTEHVASVLSKVEILKSKIGKKDLKMTDEFEKLIVKGEATETLLSLSNFEFIGLKNTTVITGNGKVGMPLSKKESSLDLVYVDKTGTVSDFMTKNVGTDKLPLKLTGVEFDLKPDYGYTLGILAKGALKTKGKEEVKKVATKALEKVIQNEDIKAKAGNLLKGLFK